VESNVADNADEIARRRLTIDLSNWFYLKASDNPGTIARLLYAKLIRVSNAWKRESASF